MRKLHDYAAAVGKTFGLWTVLELQDGKRKRFLCRCRCGLERSVDAPSVMTGRSRSCMKCSPRGNFKHGATVKGKTTPTWESWRGMIERCTNPRHVAFKYYGGRGIAVCRRWRDSFAAFLEDMGERPEGMTLDRRDSNGNYEPVNCHWATVFKQNRNRRSSRIVTAHGETLTIADWADRTGLPWSTIQWRLDNGWSPERAVSEGTAASN